MHRIQETGPLTAHAAVEVSVDATLSDPSGAPLHDGHLLDFALGDVTVDCAGVSPPSPTTTTTTTTTTTGPTTTTTGPTTTTTSGTTTSVTPTGTTTTEVTGGGGSLAGTGFPAAPLLSFGVLLVMAGGTVLLLRRARRAG